MRFVPVEGFLFRLATTFDDAGTEAFGLGFAVDFAVEILSSTKLGAFLVIAFDGHHDFFRLAGHFHLDLGDGHHFFRHDAVFQRSHVFGRKLESALVVGGGGVGFDTDSLPVHLRWTAACRTGWPCDVTVIRMGDATQVFPGLNNDMATPGMASRNDREMTSS